MLTLDGEIKIYSSPKEMPIGRYSDFQKYLAMDSSIVSKMEKAKAYLQEGNLDAVEAEINNVISGCLSLENSLVIGSYAFVVLVAEIGGKPCNDTTIEGLTDTLSKLNISQQDAESYISIVKKK